MKRLTSAIALLVPVLLAAPAALQAQTARSQYAAAKGREEILRESVKAGRAAPSLAKYRAVIAAYEAVSRRFPSTGYADNALWQGAILSLDAFDRFGEERDRRAARRLLQALVDRYPSSSLSPKGRAELERLTAAARPAPPAARPGAQTAPVAPPAAAPPAVPLLEVRQVRRTVNSDGVRVTIEVEGEVDVRSERVENPPRVLFDLAGTRPGDAILQGTLSYHDGIVRYIRVGRQPNDVTRIVLDLTGAARYSSFALYDPYRLVIDLEAERPAPVPTQRIGEEALAPPVPDPAPPRQLIDKPIEPTPPPAGASSPPPAGPPKDAPPPAAAKEPAPAEAVTPPSPRPAPTPTPRAPLRSRRLPKPYGPLPSAAGWAAADLRPPLSGRRVGTAWTTALAAPAVGGRAAIDLAHSAAIAPAPPPRPAGLAASSGPGKPAAAPAAGKAAPPAPGADKAAPPTAPPAAPEARPPAVPAPLPGGFSLARQLGLGVTRVVIDPGHGGRDPGALGTGITEAAVVLDVSLRLEKLLVAAGVDVVLTRRTDAYLPLEERTRLANAAQGDLFLSIHANASRNKNAQGIETYVLNFASNPEAEAVAARENAASAGTMSNLAGIVRAITLNNKLDESKGLAASVQTQLVKKLKGGRQVTRSQGVKQAPFVVLIGASMPSVLVEIAFISNRQEGRLLKTAAQRQRIAQALFEGIRGYQRSLKGAAVADGR